MKLLTLGEASKLTGKSKPTISKAVNDGKISGQKIDGVYQIEVSELIRVFPAKSADADQPTKSSSNQSAPNAQAEEIAELKLKHLEEKLRDAEQRLAKAEQEREKAVQDAREDRNKFLALLEHQQQPKGFWSRLRGR